MHERPPVVCGVDGCKVGWVVVWHDLAGGGLWWDVHPTLTNIAAADPKPAVIAMDVPIGLTDGGARSCDVEARRLLGVRGSSVFAAPIRQMLACASHAEACTAGRAAAGKAISLQGWAIVPKIREVDEALRGSAELRRVVHEVHPELCFWALNGERPRPHNKKKREGRAERIAVLQQHFGDAVDNAVASKPKGCQFDDLLDAFELPMRMLV